MKKNRGILFLFAVMVSILAFTACGSFLGDDDVTPEWVGKYYKYVDDVKQSNVWFELKEDGTWTDGEATGIWTKNKIAITLFFFEEGEEEMYLEGIYASGTITCAVGDTLYLFKMDGVATPVENYDFGLGTEVDPYLIKTAAQLIYFRDQVNSGQTYESTYFALDKDIDLSGMEWTPIGTSSLIQFTGSFNGNGFAISNFKIIGTGQYVGLFRYNMGIIKNLGVESFTIKTSYSGKAYAGGLVGYNYGKIERCYATGGITATSTNNDAYAGGLVGYNGGRIERCHATSEVTAISTDYNAYVGGLTGLNEGEIMDCDAMCIVAATAPNGRVYEGRWIGFGNSLIDSWEPVDGYDSGTGTEVDPYVIETAAQLIYFRDQVNSGQQYANTHFVLDRNIDLNDMEWTPIGISYIFCFAGSFDGNGFAISKFKIEIENQYIGLFGYVIGTIKNLGVESFTVKISYSSTVYVGGLVGSIYNFGRISDCYAMGTVVAINTSSLLSASSVYVGGLVGDNSGIINNCYAKSNIAASCSANAYVYAGGLVGANYFGQIKNCYATGNIVATSSSAEAGGLVGANYFGSITNGYATGDVSVVASSAYAGGLIGANYFGSITNCYTTGDIAATYSSVYAGGLVGYNYGTNAKITNCYATGDVSITSSFPFAYVSGLVGRNLGTITNCYRYDGQMVIRSGSEGRINVAGTEKSANDFTRIEFYTSASSLNWDRNIWDFVGAFRYDQGPTLKVFS